MFHFAKLYLCWLTVVFRPTGYRHFVRHIYKNLIISIIEKLTGNNLWLSLPTFYQKKKKKFPNLIYIVKTQSNYVLFNIGLHCLTYNILCHATLNHNCSWLNTIFSDKLRWLLEFLLVRIM